MRNNLIAMAIVVILIIGAVTILNRNSKKSSPGNNLNENTNQQNEGQLTPANGGNQPTVGSAEPTVSQITLNISSPANGQTVTTGTVMVTGKTIANAEVNINDKSLTADNQGNFSTQLALDQGENTINVVANDANGNFAEKELTVTYQP